MPVCLWHISSPGEDVWSGGGNLHGVLGPLPHLLYPFLPLSSNHAEGVDLKCLPSGALILKDSKAQTLQKKIELSLSACNFRLS